MGIREELYQQQQIMEALQVYSKDELVEMLAHLMKAYVIDGVTPVRPDVGKVHVPQHLRGLGFADLVETLKFHLDVPELERLSVTNGQVFVKLGDHEYAFDGPSPSSQRPPPPPVGAPAQAPPQAEQVPSAAAAQTAAPPQSARKRPKTASDRFRMLELD